MPGYIRGFVEREFADRWEFVCRVDPFTGSQGAFKYVFFGSRWAAPLDPVVERNGFPDDLAPDTKLAMLGRQLSDLDRLSNEDLDEEFQAFQENMLDSPRHASLGELMEFEWDRGISDENQSQLAEDWPIDRPQRVLRLFELVDADGMEYSEWASEADDGWEQRIVDRGVAEELVSGDWIRFDNRTVTLRPRSRRDIVPDRWFGLLELLAEDYREVRFSFYWHH